MHYSYISPLTWPGGKFNALGQIIPRIPKFQEFREPFAGSASVFFELQRRYPSRSYWINDLNQDLYNFYLQTKSDGARISGDILLLKKSFDEGQELLNYVITLPDTKYNRALKFFVLNRITYYGIGVSRQHTESKSFSLFKYKRKFTESLINRVALGEQLLKDVKITNHSYETLLKSKGEEKS